MIINFLIIIQAYMEDLGVFVVDEDAEKQDLEKYANYAHLLDIWMRSMEEGKALNSYFEKRNYKKVVIYGVGMLGRHFVDQLKNTDVQVIYTIERGAVNRNGKIYSYSEINEILGQPDVIVITPLMEYDAIKQLLNSDYKCDIVSAEEAILSI